VVKKMVIKSVPPIMMIYISEWRQYRARLVKLDEETYFNRLKQQLQFDFKQKIVWLTLHEIRRVTTHDPL
jgi:hypothetical protein